MLSYSLVQPVLGHVKMEGHSMLEPVHVAVQMATVDPPVEVSALHEVQQVMQYIYCVRYQPRAFVLCYLVLGHPLSPKEILMVPVYSLV